MGLEQLYGSVSKTLTDLFGTPQYAQQMPPEIARMIQNDPGSNMAQNYGVYVPRGSVVSPDYVHGDAWTPDEATAGYVKPRWNKFVAHINKDTLPDGRNFQGSMPLTDTVAHELGHTVQPNSGDYGRMKGVKFEDYGVSDYPEAFEILPTLRATEATQPAGKLVWGSRQGRELLSRMETLNPDMTKSGLKRYLELRMFPEHQLMHEQDSTPLKKGSSLMDYLFRR